MATGIKWKELSIVSLEFLLEFKVDGKVDALQQIKGKNIYEFEWVRI